MKGKVFKSLAAIYLSMGLFSLFLIPASEFGWWGIVQNPLTGIFAMVFGLPWTLFLSLSEATDLYYSFYVSAIGIGINTGILYWLGVRYSK